MDDKQRKEFEESILKFNPKISEEELKTYLVPQTFDNLKEAKKKFYKDIMNCCILCDEKLTNDEKDANIEADSIKYMYCFKCMNTDIYDNLNSLVFIDQ